MWNFRMVIIFIGFQVKCVMFKIGWGDCVEIFKSFIIVK